MTPIEVLVVVAIVVGYGRFRRVRYLQRQLYDHVKDLIKADEYEGYKARRKRYGRAERTIRRGDPASRRSRDFGVHVPNLVRLAHPHEYVWFATGWRAVWPRRRDVRTTVIRWTPLCSAPNQKFYDALRGEVAHFLGVDPDEVAHLPAGRRPPLRPRLRLWRTCATFERRHAARAVPDHLPLPSLPRGYDDGR